MRRDPEPLQSDLDKAEQDATSYILDAGAGRLVIALLRAARSSGDPPWPSSAPAPWEVRVVRRARRAPSAGVSLFRGTPRRWPE